MAHIQTFLAKAGCTPDNDVRALAPPLYLATTFERDSDESYPHGFKYGREGNPTRARLEQVLSQLEGGSDARAFSSGMSACHAVLQALEPGSHIVIPEDVYHGFRRIVYEQFSGRGLEATSVDPTDLDGVKRALRPNTKLIWIETPSNPLLRISDIRTLSDLAHDNGAIAVVDSTWTTAIIQKAFSLGADVVVHSLTKYLSGHSDALGGAVIARESSDFFDRVDAWQRQAGPVLDPFSSWLTLRGIRTLDVRLSRQCENASRIAHFLSEHPNVTCVHFPGLASHPEFDLASQQMSMFGAMVSFEVISAETAQDIAANVDVFTRATSLGGTESLIEHRISMEGPGSNTPPGLLRLSIGLEHCEDLLKDLDQSLRRV